MERLPLWLKIGFTVWVLVWIPIYWKFYGPRNFLWFCDIGNVVLAAALWRESALLFSWQAVSVLVVQIAMSVDMAGRLLFGVHPIGGTEYMWDAAHYPLHIRLLSLFHVVTPPLLVWGLVRLGYDRRAFVLQSTTAWVVLPVCFFFTPPDCDINWVFGPLDRPQTTVAPWLYFVGCMIAYPLVLYLPTHLALARWSRGRSPSR
jgi:hypothetical protein